MNYMPGSTIGPYQIIDSLGEGGMAVVYKVWDTTRLVPLALKMLKPDFAEDRIFLRRFEKEAATLSRLQHPNIVRFYGLESHQSVYFLVMDYIEGVTLRRQIFDRARPFTPEEVRQPISQVLAALNYAHQLGIIHCDIKPANILISSQGNALVSDFGIARLTESSTLTNAGLGTPAYIAPEQIAGQSPTPQTDLYSLGIVLYEMLSGGERPFTGERANNSASTTDRILWEKVNAEPVPLSHFAPTLPPDLISLVMSCLARDPSQRPASASQMLGSLMLASSPAAAPASPDQSAADQTGVIYDTVPLEGASTLPSKLHPVVDDSTEPAPRPPASSPLPASPMPLFVPLPASIIQARKPRKWLISLIAGVALLLVTAAVVLFSATDLRWNLLYGEPVAFYRVDVKSWMRTSTLVNVMKGDRVQVNYVYGTWSIDPNNFPYTDGSGVPGPKLEQLMERCFAPACSGQPGMLIMELSNGSSTYLVGNQSYFYADDTGYLEFTINDVYTGFNDNQGTVTVDVKVWRP